jgi:hypothetical protein
MTERSNLTRRRAIKAGTGLAAGGAVASGELPDRVDPVDSSEALAVSTGIAIGVAGFIAGGTAYYGVQQIVGSPNDDNEVTSALEWEDHVRAYEKAKVEHNAIKNTLASLRREADLSTNKARQDAIYAVYDIAASGGTKSEAETAAKDAIKDVYSKSIKSLTTSYTNHIQKVYYHLDEGTAGQHYDWYITGDFYKDEHWDSQMARGDASASYSGAKKTVTVTLPNGDQVTPSVMRVKNAPSGEYAIIEMNPFRNDISPMGSSYDEEYCHGIGIVRPDPADYSGVDSSEEPDGNLHRVWIDATEWHDTHQELLTQKDNVINQVSTIMDNYWDDASSGDYSLSELAAPGYASDIVTDPKDYQDALTGFEIMGYPTAKTATVVSVYDSANDTWTDYDGRLAWIGNNGNTLEVGKEYDTANIVGTLYFAYQYEDDSGNQQADIVELSTKFEIVSTKDGSDTVGFDTRELPEADTNPEKTRELYEAMKEAIEEARENTVDTATGGGGGGGFLDQFGLGSVGVPEGAVLAGGAYLAYDQLIDN